MKNYDWYEEFSPKLLVQEYRDSEYALQAEDFAQKHGIKLYVLAKAYDYYFPDDKDERWIYKMQLVRNGKSYTFTFGQSISAGDTIPGYYDVFAAMTKYDPGTFEDFCSEYGYDEDSRRAYATWEAVCKEYEAMERLFGDVMDELAEIQ